MRKLRLRRDQKNYLNHNSTEKFAEKYNQLESEVHDKLWDLILERDEESQFGVFKAIEVNVFDYVELAIIDEKLVFLDKNGYHYFLYSDCQLTDLIDIISKQEDLEIARKKAKESNLALSEELVSKAEINIVTCGSCGDVNLHRTSQQEITCEKCGFTDEPCHFPDLFTV